MNLMFKSAEEYLLKVGNQRLKTYATANKSTEKEIEEIVGVGCYSKFKRFKLNTLVA